MSSYIYIREQVDLAKRVKQGLVLSEAEQQDMALTLLQLHAGYERQRAELIRVSPRGFHGPAEWQSFERDDVPVYPVIINTHGKYGNWPDDK